MHEHKRMLLFSELPVTGRTCIVILFWLLWFEPPGSDPNTDMILQQREEPTHIITH